MIPSWQTQKGRYSDHNMPPRPKQVGPKVSTRSVSTMLSLTCVTRCVWNDALLKVSMSNAHSFYRRCPYGPITTYNKHSKAHQLAGFGETQRGSKSSNAQTVSGAYRRTDKRGSMPHNCLNCWHKVCQAHHIN